MKNWYIIHAQTGSEEKVKISLENKITTEALQEFIGQVVIPTEQVAEIRAGKKRVSQRKFSPGIF